MDDLISRQAAIDAMHQYSYYDDFDTLVLDEDIAVIALKELPSAEPEIIHCRDCKYASPNGEYGCKAYHFKLYETHEMKADDFCSKAERRTDE